MPIDLSTLNPAQLDAVLFTEGPCLVIAGAGTGKTTVLTKRIARLVDEGYAHPTEILAVTFTNKASKEMQERLAKLLGDRARGIWCSTFHSLCVRLIRADAKRLGLAPGFTIYDADDSKRLLKRLMKEHGIDESSAKPSAVAGIISDAKNRMTEPSDFGGGPAERAAVELWGPYHQSLKASNALDFDSLISEALRLLQENPDVLRGYQTRFRYVLADENQDVNMPQSLLLKLLAGKYRNLMVVGDEDQCFPAGTFVATPSGGMPIEDVREGDLVISGTGKGMTDSTVVTATTVREYRGNLVTLELESGRAIEGTPEHLIPAVHQSLPGHTYVYMMHKRGLGYRIGQVLSEGRGGKEKAAFLGHVRRCRQERADRMWIVKDLTDASEANYYEHLLSYKYGIPELVFHTAGRAMGLDDEQVRRLYSELDTQSGAERLLADHGLHIDHPHHTPECTSRGSVHRIRINLYHLAGSGRRVEGFGKGGRYKDPAPQLWHKHVIQISSSHDDARHILDANGFGTCATKGDTNWAFTREYHTIEEARTAADRILGLVPGAELNEKVRVLSTRKSMPKLPMAAIHVGSIVAVLDSDGTLIEDRVVRVRHRKFRGKVYGISVGSTENYIAEGVCVSNCVYTFRGSDPRYILEFTKEWPEAITIKLEQNYRSTGHILDAANAVISNNENRRPKTLFTDRGKGHKVLGIVANDDRDEAWKAVHEIQRLMREEKYSYADFAVFYRTNAQSRQVEDAFLRAGIPYKIVGGTRYFDRAEVRDVMAYLKCLVNPADGISLRRIVNVPRRGIGDTTLNKLEARAKAERLTLWEAMREECYAIPTLPKKAGEAIWGFVKLMEGLRAKAMPEEGTVDLAAAVEGIIGGTGMVEAYKALGDDESLGRAENVEEFLNVAIEFAAGHQDATLADFVEWLALRTDLDDVEEGVPHAVLMTVHTAKGLEFPAVFVLGLEEDVFPHANSIGEGAAQLEEERRLAYVALSRAERHLILLRARQRMSFGKLCFNKPSRFLAEIPPECLEAQEGFAGGREEDRPLRSGFDRPPAGRPWPSRKPASAPAAPRPATVAAPRPAVSYARGDRVTHKAFGSGTVITGGTDSVEVRFDSGQVKKLMPAYAPMERVG